jgi:hypothetical protein
MFKLLMIVGNKNIYFTVTWLPWGSNTNIVHSLLGPKHAMEPKRTDTELVLLQVLFK